MVEEGGEGVEREGVYQGGGEEMEVYQQGVDGGGGIHENENIRK